MGRPLRNLRVMIQRAMTSPRPLEAIPSARTSKMSIIHTISLPNPAAMESVTEQ